MTNTITLSFSTLHLSNNKGKLNTKLVKNEAELYKINLHKEFVNYINISSQIKHLSDVALEKGENLLQQVIINLN